MNLSGNRVRSATRIACGIALALVAFAPGPAAIADDTTAPAHVLVVGTKESPPFAMKTPDGDWTGLTIDLCRQLAADVGRTVSFREFTKTTEMLGAVERGEVDAAAAAISITSGREAVVDFTHPYYVCALAVATRATESSIIPQLRKALGTHGLSRFCLGVLFLLFTAALMVSLSERRLRHSHFGGPLHHGVGAGVWWAAVTMAGIGYGDKVPRGLVGRIFAVVWMLASIVLIALFTATVTSSVTLSKLQARPMGEAELRTMTGVGTCSATRSADYLTSRVMLVDKPVYFATPSEGLQALADGKLEAFVFDEPILTYLVRKDFRGRLAVSTEYLEPELYGIALRMGSPLRHVLNTRILAKVITPEWRSLMKEYFVE